MMRASWNGPGPPVFRDEDDEPCTRSERMTAIGELTVALFQILLIAGGFFAVAMAFYRLVQIAVRHGAHEPWISFSVLLGVIQVAFVLSVAVRVVRFRMNGRPRKKVA